MQDNFGTSVAHLEPVTDTEVGSRPRVGILSSIREDSWRGRNGHLVRFLIDIPTSCVQECRYILQNNVKDN